MPPPQFDIGSDSDNTIAGAVLGRYEALGDSIARAADTTSAGQTDHIPNSDTYINDEFIKPYRVNHTRVFNESRNDFQIGSIVLPVPPLEISVRRIRDVLTMPVIRGNSVSAKSGEGIVSIDISFDVPDFTNTASDVNPFAALLAELKTCPFTVIRNRGLSGKISQNDLEGLPEITRESLFNIQKFEQYRTNINNLLNTFLNPVNQFGVDVDAPWQRQLRVDFDNLLADIVGNPTKYPTPEEYDSNTPVRSTGGDVADQLLSIITNALNANEDDSNYGRGQFGSKVWDALKAKATNAEFQKNFRDAVRGYVLAAKEQVAINAKAREATIKDKYTPPPKFIPVALQRVAFSTVPGQPGRARIDMNFELFNYTAYVGRLLWHSFRGKEQGWGYTDDPAEADLLQRWRDSQFLDFRGSKTAKGYVPLHALDIDKLNDTYRMQTKGVSISDEVPGYFRYLREAWRNRRCRTPSAKPEDHRLTIFYPESVPQIRTALPQERGSYYSKLVVDSGTHPKVEERELAGGGIVEAVQVVWQLSMARQIDEATGLVTHQWAGGSQLEARFEICVPTEQGDRPRDEVLIGQINRMYNVIERSRKLLPSEGFIPTTLFIQNPITELFGAYCFEATDVPIRQSSPGKISVSMQFTETIPVVGLGEYVENPESDITNDEFLDVVAAIAEIRDSTIVYKRRGLFDDRKVLGVLNNVIDLPGINTLPKAARRKDRLSSFGFIGELFEYLISIGAMPESLLVNANTLRQQEGTSGILRNLLENQFPDERVSLEYRRLYSEYGPRFLQPYIEYRSGIDSQSWRDLTADCFKIVVLNFIITGTAITQARTLAGALVQDPVSVVEARLLNALFNTERPGVLDRVRIVRDLFFVPAPAFRREASLAIDAAFKDADNDTYSGRDRLIRELVENQIIPALNTDLYVDRLLSLAQQTELDAATRPVTAQLYPDMILPTYAELLGINLSTVAQSSVPVQHLARFIPSFDECGVVRRDSAAGSLPARSLNDIVDPDVWFYRDPFNPPQITKDYADFYQRRNNTLYVKGGERSPTVESGQKGTEFRASRTTDHDDISAMGKCTRESIVAQSNIEQQVSQNKRRMLYAFPTYSMEFYIEGTQSRPLFESDSLPFNWEARIINNLPLLSLEIFEDPYIPCQAEVTFIGRKAALRNESWRWLDPVPSIDTDTFTNNPARVREFLYNRKSIASDPTFLTKLALTPGARVSIRVGYGTDLNNSKLLPIKLSGTIGKISLGEVSQMTVQSLGTQLINPVTNNIGGGGWWSPNRLWDGRYTLRAFTDIFQNLDTRYLGRRQTGLLEDDIRDLTDVELSRIWRIGATTRTTSEIVSSASSGVLGALVGIAPYIVFGQAGGEWFTRSVLNTSLAGQAQSAQDLIFDPGSRVFPEMLNVYPTVTGVSDWAISNTEGKSLPGVYWLDMIARLNPGAIWWPHPYGGECRLFFGRPDQMYREHPTPVSAEDYSILEKASIGTLGRETSDILDDLWAESAQLRAKSRIVLTVPEEGNAVIIADGNRIEYTESAQTPLDELVRDYVDRQRAQFSESLFSGTTEGFSWGGNFERVDLYIGVPSEGAVHSIYQEVNSVLDPEIFNQVVRGLLIRHANEIIEILSPTDDLVPHEDWVNMPVILDDLSKAFPGDSYGLGQFILRLVSIKEADLEKALGDDGDIEIPAEIRDERLIFLHRRLREISEVLLRLIADANNDGLNALDKLANKNLLGEQLQRLRYAAGYRRFRRYHFVMSGSGLLSNRLEIGQDRMANAVSVDGIVTGYNVLPEERRVVDLNGDVDNLNFGIFQWAKGAIGENDRDRVLGILIPNALAEGLAKMYGGAIELRGDPSIKPHDIIYMLDLHNGVYGPVKACSVIHSLNPQSGYTTIVRPQMHTQAFTSRALTEHVVGQRVLKTLAVSSLAAGVVGFAFGGLGGALVGFGGAVLAAGLFSFAEVRDSIGRAGLTNFSFADALAGSTNKEQMESIIRALMVDGYIASNNVSVISPVFDRGMLNKMTNLDQPELGVQAFPLIRLGTGTPLVAGMRSAGVLDIDPSITGVLDESVAKTIEQEVDNFFYIVGNYSEDVVNGWNTVRNALKRRIDTSERNRRALERRGIRTQE